MQARHTAQGAEDGARRPARRKGYGRRAQQAVEDVRCFSSFLASAFSPDELFACSKIVRLAIAQVLTVIRQTQKSHLREAYKGKVRCYHKVL